MLFKEDLHNDLGNCNGFFQSLQVKAWIALEIVHGCRLQNITPIIIIVTLFDLCSQNSVIEQS